MPGRHNVQNALAAIGVALELGIDDATIQQGFAKFGGVKRRFTKVGEVADGRRRRSSTITAHHPVEIRAVLSAAREGVGEPRHRGGAAASLFAARQSDGGVPGARSTMPTWCSSRRSMPRARRRSKASMREALVEGLKRRGHRSAATIGSGRRSWRDELARRVQPGDMVVCLGAGDITKWAAGLAAAIEAAR